MCTSSASTNSETRRSPGQNHVAPRSTDPPSDVDADSNRPPTRCRASSTTTDRPSATAARAAARPAIPAPTTARSTIGSAAASVDMQAVSHLVDFSDMARIVARPTLAGGSAPDDGVPIVGNDSEIGHCLRVALVRGRGVAVPTVGV